MPNSGGQIYQRSHTEKGLYCKLLTRSNKFQHYNKLIEVCFVEIRELELIHSPVTHSPLNIDDCYICIIWKYRKAILASHYRR